MPSSVPWPVYNLPLVQGASRRFGSRRSVFCCTKIAHPALRVEPVRRASDSAVADALIDKRAPQSVDTRWRMQRLDVPLTFVECRFGPILEEEFDPDRFFDGALRLWDAAAANLQHVERLTGDRRISPESIAFSPDGKTLAAGVATRGTDIRLWHAADGALIGSLKSRKNALVCHIAFSPDAKVIAAYSG